MNDSSPQTIVWHNLRFISKPQLSGQTSSGFALGPSVCDTSIYELSCHSREVGLARHARAQ